MTLKQCADHLYNISVAGYFNGEKFTRKELYGLLKGQFRPDDKYRDKLYMGIALLDGWWYFTVNQYAPGQFDYYIPDDRDTEARVIAEFMERAGV